MASWGSGVKIVGYAVENVIPRHLSDIKKQREKLVSKTISAVRDRLTKEINYWDRRAQDLKEKERAGKNTRLPAGVAQERADQLADRLQSRLAELQKERHIVPGTPQVKGGALIIPRGLLEKLQGRAAVSADDGVDAEVRKRVEMIAMRAVMEAERSLGREPKDVSATKGIGHDIESRSPDGIVFIEVKGRAGVGENRLPAARDGEWPREIPLGVELQVAPPYGVDTYVLLTTDEPLPDLSVFEWEPVRGGTRGAAGGARLGPRWRSLLPPRALRRREALLRRSARALRGHAGRGARRAEDRTVRL